MKVDKGWFQASISSRHEGWIRLFGYGVSVKDVGRKDLLFSDRNRVGACVKVGPVLLRALAPLPRGAS